MNSLYRLVVCAVGLMGLTSSIPVRAQETASLIAQADAAYAQREDLQQAKAALETYERAMVGAETSRVLECGWKASRAAWWVGQHVAKRAERLAYHQKGIDFAKGAILLNPNCVEAHFWLGSNLGSFGEAKGILKSLAMVKPIRQEMAEVIRLNDRYQNGGVYHVLGAVDYKVPGFAGGNKKRAKEELEKALVLGPLDPFNHYYMAEFCTITGDKVRAQAELDLLKTLQVAPEDEPELRMLQKKAAHGFK